ncbi:MAG: hypothetical protein GY790_21460 [Bacteroidetes bacterium]|nr:hypothetical protein [Bacteroidota bacterium]
MKSIAFERRAFLWFMILILPLLVLRSLDFPVNVDEILHYGHAEKVIDWYQSSGEDQSCLHTPRSNLKYYGQSVDNFTALINRWIRPEDPYRVRHITGAVFGWLLIFFTGLIAKELSGRYITSIVASLVLMLLPSVMGQYCNNLKDIPFAAGYAFALLSMIRCFRSLPRIPWKYIFQLSGAIAFLVSVRVGGLIIYLYLLIFLILWFVLNRKESIFSLSNIKGLYRLSFQAIAIVVIGYLGGLLFWPYGLMDPIAHPFESLSLMEHYSISIRQIFQGIWYWSDSLPGNYLYVWMLIALPEIVLLGLLLYVFSLFYKKETFSFNELLVSFYFAFPLIYVVIIDSNLYSGWRQLYFVAGPLSVLSALGLERLYDIFRNRKVVLIPLLTLLVLAATLPVIHYWQNPGTAYVYFNSISGGNKKGWSNYEYDYYWHGMKNAVEWFDESIEEDGAFKTVASNFDISVYLKHRSDIKVKYVHYDNRSEENWDYGVFGVNYLNPYQLKNDRWQPDTISKIFTDHKHPLAVITKPSNRDDFKGVSLAEKGRYPEAVKILEEKIRTDSNNFILFEYLAESYYRLGQTDDCRRIIEQGKALHPWSEKLNMLDAQIDYDRGDFKSALEKTLKVLKNNNKYINIVPLLIACYEKTGQEGKALELKRKFDLP